MTKLNGLRIEGRRWFQKSAGNTYHSVRIFANNEQLAYIPFEYGYGDRYLQTAIDWLKAEKLIPADAGIYDLRETLDATYKAIDVDRKKDL